MSSPASPASAPVPAPSPVNPNNPLGIQQVAGAGPPKRSAESDALLNQVLNNPDWKLRSIFDETTLQEKVAPLALATAKQAAKNNLVGGWSERDYGLNAIVYLKENKSILDQVYGANPSKDAVMLGKIGRTPLYFTPDKPKPKQSKVDVAFATGEFGEAQIGGNLAGRDHDYRNAIFDIDKPYVIEANQAGAHPLNLQIFTVPGTPGSTYFHTGNQGDFDVYVNGKLAGANPFLGSVQGGRAVIEFRNKGEAAPTTDIDKFLASQARPNFGVAPTPVKAPEPPKNMYEFVNQNIGTAASLMRGAEAAGIDINKATDAQKLSVLTQIKDTGSASITKDLPTLSGSEAAKLQASLGMPAAPTPSPPPAAKSTSPTNDLFPTPTTQNPITNPASSVPKPPPAPKPIPAPTAPPLISTPKSTPKEADPLAALLKPATSTDKQGFGSMSIDQAKSAFADINKPKTSTITLPAPASDTKNAAYSITADSKAISQLLGDSFMQASKQAEKQALATGVPTALTTDKVAEQAVKIITTPDALKNYGGTAAEQAANKNLSINYAAFKANSEIESANKGSSSAFGLSNSDVKALQIGGVKDADKLQAQIDTATKANKDILTAQAAAASASKDKVTAADIMGTSGGATKTDSILDLTRSPGTPPPLVGQADMGMGTPTKGGLGFEAKDMSGNISKYVPATINTVPDITNPAKVDSKLGMVPITTTTSMPTAKQVMEGSPVAAVDKPSGNPLLDFGKGFAAPFQNMVTQVGDLITGQKHENKADVEGDLFGTAIKAGKDAVTGQKITAGDDLSKIGQNIADNPAYAAGNLVASAIMWLGPGEASKAIKGISEGSKAIQESSNILKAAEQSGKAVGVEVKGVQPLNLVQKGSEVIETPLKTGPLGVTYADKPLTIIPKIAETKPIDIPLIGKTVNIPTKIDLVAPPALKLDTKITNIPGTSTLVKIPTGISKVEPTLGKNFEVVAPKLTVPVPKSANAFDIVGKEATESVGYYVPKSDKLTIFTEPKTTAEMAKTVGQEIKPPKSTAIFDKPTRETIGLDIGQQVANVSNPTKALKATSADAYVVSEAKGLKDINIPSFTSQLTKPEASALTSAAKIDPAKAVKDLFNANSEVKGGVDKLGKIINPAGETKAPEILRVADVYTFKGTDALKAAENATKRTDQITGAQKALEDMGLSASGKKTTPFKYDNPLDAALEKTSGKESSGALKEVLKENERNADVFKAVGKEASSTGINAGGLTGDVTKAISGLGMGAGRTYPKAGSSSAMDVDYGTQFFPTPKDNTSNAIKSFTDSFSKSQSGNKSNTGLGNMPKLPTDMFTKPNTVVKNLPDFGIVPKSRDTTKEITGLNTGPKNITDILNLPVQTPRSTPTTGTKTIPTTGTQLIPIQTNPFPNPTPEIPRIPKPRQPKPDIFKDAGDFFNLPRGGGGSGKLKKGLTIWKIFDPFSGEYK